MHRLRRGFRAIPDSRMRIEFDGQFIEDIPSFDGVTREIFSSGYHEFAATQCMKRAVKSGMTVLDVGAERGYNTLLAAKRVGDHGMVHAFEPSANARPLLERNVQLNGYKNIAIYDIALFDQEKCMAIEDSALGRVASPDDGGVRCVPFDTLSKERAFGRIGFVKIDVEGAELNVLRGMRQTLIRDMPDLLIEVHPVKMKSFGCSVSDLTRFLIDVGYRWDQLMISRGLLREIIARQINF